MERSHLHSISEIQKTYYKPAYTVKNCQPHLPVCFIELKTIY